MSLQQDVSEILANLEERRPDKWGQQAARIADGIRESGLSDAIAGSGMRIEAELASLGSMLGVAASKITAEISRSNTFLAAIDDTLRNPQATAADERYRRGITALRKNWTDDAVTELSASIEANPYFAPAHAYLGIALSSEGQDDQAIEAFKRATKYATPDEPQIATGCALLSASKLERLGRVSDAIALLAVQIETYPSCPELRLTWSRLSRDSTGVERALWMAPELATVAVAAGVPHADRIAQQLAVASDGPVAQAREFSSAHEAALRASYLDAGQTSNDIRNLDTADTPEALRIAGSVLTEAPIAVQPLRDAIQSAILKDSQIVTDSATTSDQRAAVEKRLGAALNSSGFWTVLLAIGIAVPVGILIAAWVGQASEPSAIGIGVVFTVIALVVGWFTVGYPASNLFEKRKELSAARTELRSISERASTIATKKAVSEIAKRAPGLATVERIAGLRADRVRPWMS